MGRQIAGNCDEDVPALVRVAPRAELPDSRLQHLIRMEACIFAQHRMRERGDQRLRRMAEREMPCHLCVPQIKPEHIGDAVHPGSDGTECVPLPRRHVISARLCSTISECACHYTSPCRTAAHGADGVRRTPRYGRGTPCGSSRSTVLRMRFARVNAETSGGLECRSIERGG